MYYKMTIDNKDRKQHENENKNFVIKPIKWEITIKWKKKQ